MSSTDEERATAEQIAHAQHLLKESNDDRKRDKLRRQAIRAHEWRVQVWAQCELKIRAANASLEALGTTPVEPFKPKFEDDAMLHHYSTMQLSK
jgi:hypothetical protein